MKEVKNPSRRTAAEYGVITLNIWIMVVGIYSFRFPNHFASGGAVGFSTVISEVTRWSTGDFTPTVNTPLLLPGFTFLGKGFGIKTAYANMFMFFTSSLLERVCLPTRPLTDEPLLELMFAILLPAVGTAILFNLGASSGGTDVIAMTLKKHINLNTSTVPMLIDVAAAASSFFIFGPETELFSATGLAAKSLVIDDVIQNPNLCKCFNVIYDSPELICGYVISTLHRSATVYHAQGIFPHNEKTVIMATVKRSQALKLRNYIRSIEPTAFMLISSSSEIIGKGFLASQKAGSNRIADPFTAD